MRISLAIILVVFITVGLISILVNLYIKDEFKNYILRGQDKTVYEMVDKISKEYNKNETSWNTDSVHTIGMNALYEGYIIKLYDAKNKIIWDAEASDSTMCSEVMKDIASRMKVNYPKLDGQIISKNIDVRIDGEIVGMVEINYYGPFFFNEEDFDFLNSLNKILIIVGVISLIFSVVIGIIVAKKISDPIKKTVEAAKQISYGEYENRIDEKTNTKEVEELIIAINNLACSLENQEKLRKQLTSDIAHEFRTPLTTLQTHLEAMIEGVWEADISRLQSCLDEIIRISKMVKDLENLARVEGDNLRLKKEDMSLIGIVEKVVSNFAWDINNKGLFVHIKGKDIHILADGDRITQVVINLLCNAIKYTNDGGNIDIVVFEEDKFLGLTIKDSGIGIPREELPFIFERFYRTDKSRNHTTGGSGIGLTIVKSIVKAHGGIVDVESELNNGSSFTIKLPKAMTIM